MQVLFHYAADAGIKAMLAPYGAKGLKITCIAEGDDEAFYRALPKAEIIWHVLQPLSADVLKRAPRLKLIQKIGVGVNTIDLDYARANNIAVCNMPGSNSRAVAEMTLLLMLSALRRLPHIDSRLREGVWAHDDDAKQSFAEIGGKTVGFIGFGATPQILAPVIAALGGRVVYANRSPKDVPYPRQDFDDVITSADIISLHLPLTTETERLINADVIAQMKPGAILINTARGGLVDEAALYAALKSGHLAGAGLDVFDPEPAHSDNPLFSLPNVTVTPHIAWLTRQTWSRSLDIAAQNSLAIRYGDALRFQVT